MNARVKIIGFASLAIFILLFCAVISCRGGGGGDDDSGNNPSDDDGGDDGGTGLPAKCEGVYAYGGGIAEYADGAWTDITPDFFAGDFLSAAWRLRGAAWAGCGEVIFVGRDDASKKGVMVSYAKSSFAVPVTPNVSEDYDLLAVAADKDEAIAVGGDWTTGKALILVRKDGEWASVTPPASVASANWWLTDVVLTGSGAGYATGVDVENNSSILLRLNGDEWTSEAAPMAGDIPYHLYNLDMVDKNNGLFIGRNLEAGMAMTLWLADGDWLFPDNPTISATDWDLVSVSMTAKDHAFLAGRSFGENIGLLMEFNAGHIGLMQAPSFDGSWTLGAVTAQNNGAIACGEDQSTGEGVILRYADDAWTVETRLPFPLGGLLADH